jgi:hypothetical protein
MVPTSTTNIYKLGGYRLPALLDDTAEGDGRVVSFALDSRDGVGVRFGDGCEEMEVSGGKGSRGVNNAANGRAVAATKNVSQLKGDVCDEEQYSW